MDAGYDYEAIYTQIYRMGHQSVIAYNKRNEPEPIGFDKHFAPTCVREHSYRYDSFDHQYETLKYTRPKECKDFPLANDGLSIQSKNHNRSYKIYRTSSWIKNLENHL
ncbi:Uncharacterised protein [Mycobacteroides abscessus subsp. abscessus]|nr:Uncharacterised protein [Mycobacteroides abscessus subsp. abscessus]